MEYLIIVALFLLIGTLVASPFAVFLPTATISLLLIARMWQSVEQHDRILRAMGVRGEKPAAPGSSEPLHETAGESSAE